MTVEIFEKLYQYHFKEKWSTVAPTPLHASNPYPFTLGELESLIQQKLMPDDFDLLLDYGSIEGYQPLRQMLSTVAYPSLNADNLLTCTGAQEGIYISMHALLEAGDKVIAFTPAFEPLIATARQIGCQLDLHALDHEQGWQLDMQKLEAALDAKTKMVIINFPHNPTGALLSKSELQAVVDVCKKHNVWLFSDEVFRGLEHNKADRLPAVAEIYNKGISLGALSKAYAAPALRVGWLASQDDGFLARCETIKSYLSICNDQLGEIAAVSVIKHTHIIIDKTRQRLLSNIKKLELLRDEYPESFRFHSPKAGCTVFAMMAENSEFFAQRLAEQEGLLVIPHPAFCTEHNGIRLGFAGDKFHHHLSQFEKML